MYLRCHVDHDHGHALHVERFGYCGNTPSDLCLHGSSHLINSDDVYSSGGIYRDSQWNSMEWLCDDLRLERGACRHRPDDLLSDGVSRRATFQRLHNMRLRRRRGGDRSDFMHRRSSGGRPFLYWRLDDSLCLSGDANVEQCPDGFLYMGCSVCNLGGALQDLHLRRRRSIGGYQLY